MLRSLVNREYGRSTVRDNLPAIDSLLFSLTCNQDDEHPGIFSTSNTAPSSDLLYTCKFSPLPGFEHILALANEDGKIALQNTNIVGKGRPIQGYQAHENAIFDLCWSPTECKIATGSGDQSSILLDIGASSVTPTSVFRGHTASIKTVDFAPASSSVFASGSRDGSIMVWDVRVSCNAMRSRPENAIRNAHPLNAVSEVKSSRSKKRTTPGGSAVNSVTAVIFQTENTLISSGAADGNIHVWDLRKNYTAYKGDPLPKYKISCANASTRNGVTSLCLNPGKTLLYVATMDDVIYEYNVAAYGSNPVGIYGGHDQHSFYIKSCLSGDGNYLLSGSSDDHAYIWRIGEGPRPLLKLEGHGAEVTCVAWCTNDITKVVTCADDVRHRIWRVNPAAAVDYDGSRRIRGRALPLGPQTALPKACAEVLNRLKKPLPATQSCRTPKLTIITSEHQQLKNTPDLVLSSPVTSRVALSPVEGNSIELTPDHRSSGVNIRDKAGASRKLELDQSTDYFSPTRNLPNYVVDGLSPHGKTRAGTKRKKLDWLTDLGRKMSQSPTSHKMRKLK